MAASSSSLAPSPTSTYPNIVGRPETRLMTHHVEGALSVSHVRHHEQGHWPCWPPF